MNKKNIIIYKHGDRVIVENDKRWLYFLDTPMGGYIVEPSTANSWEFKQFIAENSTARPYRFK